MLSTAQAPSLEEIETILDRRERQALALAERAPLPKSKQASIDEAAFIASLKSLVSELAMARTQLMGSSELPVTELLVLGDSARVNAMDLRSDLAGLLSLIDSNLEAAPTR